MIVGIDEVGRGAWAGPLCVGAVMLGEVEIDGLTDSKKLSAKRREKLALEIKQKARGVGLGWVSAKVIDQIGLSAALKLAAERALSQIKADYSQVIVDGTIMLVDDPRAVTMAKADFLVPSVSAASIVAKVARDHYMSIIAEKFPGYSFASHVGYGTAAHQASLTEYGPSPLHRMSFGPLKVIAEKVTTVRAPSSGHVAESKAANYLAHNGFVVIDHNWKTKWCEIDIIAEKNGVIHFVEVKYRKKDAQGTGLAAITPKKLRQMKFAAELWLAHKPQENAVLSALEVCGTEFTISEFIEHI